MERLLALQPVAPTLKQTQNSVSGSTHTDLMHTRMFKRHFNNVTWLLYVCISASLLNMNQTYILMKWDTSILYFKIKFRIIIFHFNTSGSIIGLPCYADVS